MKPLKTMAILGLLCFLAMAGTALAGDTLSEVQKKGVLVAGIRDSVPPFGYPDPHSGQIVGYDIDYVQAFAKKLGVAVKLVPVTPGDRISMLQQGKIDIIAATMTTTEELAKSVDFSHIYFMTGQRFITRKGSIRLLADMGGKTVGVAKGTTAGGTLQAALPNVTVRTYDDYPKLLQGLRAGEVVAVTTDGDILNGLFAGMTDREAFEIPKINISGDTFGFGILKGDTRFLKFIDDTIFEMEKSGEADVIFDRWFGSDTPYRRIKNFNRGLR